MLSEKIWTIKRLLEWTTEYLSGKGFKDARLNAELLLCHTLKYDNRINLYLHFDKPLRQSELNKFKELLKRRLTHEPIQYIVGEAEFMGFRFKVDKRVLIPRPETELLVEVVVDFCNKLKKNIKILDIGTGCANIPISIVKLFPEASVTAIDSSKSALEVASENIKQHNLIQKIELKFLNIFDDVSGLGKFDIVVSNPPYISKDEYRILPDEIKNYEPYYALTDNSDGLSYHRRIADVARKLFNEFGWIFLEVAYDQSKKVADILENFGYFDIEIFRDLRGIERIVKAKWSN